MACDKLTKIRENLIKNVPVEERVKNMESTLTLLDNFGQKYFPNK